MVWGASHRQFRQFRQSRQYRGSSEDEDEYEDERMLYREPMRKLAAAADGTAAVG